MPAKHKKLVITIWILLIFFAFIHKPASAEERFPVFDCILPNVEFWVTIYSQYTTSQALLHDSENLAVVYEVLDLKPYDAPGARKFNRRRIRAAETKYRKILHKLSQNPGSNDKECRRVADLFGNPDKGSVYLHAGRRLRCQIGQKNRFEAGLIRSGAYIDQIRSIFKSYGLPEDLAYLPHVESSFNPKAYSKFGAAGLWQFTRSTGRRFMKVGYELDERRDPFASAVAAAQLLKENHTKLGTWPLAITAYNHGAAGMLKAKARHGDYPSIFSDYRSRIFKFASRNFYAEFLAARQVAKRYTSYFGSLMIDQAEPTRSLVMLGFAPFDVVCRHFNLNPEKVKKLNPALREPVLNGQKYIPKGYALRLPKPSSPTITVANLVLPPGVYHDHQKPSRFYTVQRGDTAGKIARMHGVPLSDLIMANNLNHRATIYPHQTLRIPLPGQAGQNEPAPLLAEDAGTAKPPPPDESTSNPSSPIEPEPASTSLPSPVMAAVIPLGSQLIQPMPEQSPSQSEPSLEIVTADVQFENLRQQDGIPIGVLQVEVEETLGHYAEWAKVRTWKIRHFNGFSYGQILNLHQKVKIPLDRSTPQDFVESRYEFHKRLQEDFFAVYRIEELQPYTVRPGDNYWTLCRERFKVPLWLLKHCNPETDLADLRCNQKLWIPTIDKITTDDPSEPSEDEDIDNPALQTEEGESDTLALKKVNSQVSP